MNSHDAPCKAHYACLSYCWGGIKSIETTKATLESFQCGIPFNLLPQTYREAIELARRLDLQYLWIDSL